MIDRLLANHQAEPRQIAADHVVKHFVAGMAFDVLEQQCRAFCQTDQIGDVSRFKLGADFDFDALKLSHGLGFLEPRVELAGIASTAWTRFRLLNRDRVAASVYGHFHSATPLSKVERTALQFRFKVDRLDGRGNFGALSRDCIGKFFGTAIIHDLAGGLEPVSDEGVC